MPWAAIWTGLKFLANPLNWGKAFQAVTFVIGLLRSVADWFRKQEQEKKKKEIRDATQEIVDANKIEDDDERLKAKAKAACRLEKAINPSADCDS